MILTDLTAEASSSLVRPDRIEVVSWSVISGSAGARANASSPLMSKPRQPWQWTKGSPAEKEARAALSA
jgi:hypothetical protein